jgi:hypothetical protein
MLQLLMLLRLSLLLAWLLRQRGRRSLGLNLNLPEFWRRLSLLG